MEKKNQAPDFDEPSEQQAIVHAQLELLKCLAKSAVRMAVKSPAAVDDNRHRSPRGDSAPCQSRSDFGGSLPAKNCS